MSQRNRIARLEAKLGTEDEAFTACACELVAKKIIGTLTEDEAAELGKLRAEHGQDRISRAVGPMLDSVLEQLHGNVFQAVSCGTRLE